LTRCETRLTSAERSARAQNPLQRRQENFPHQFLREKEKDKNKKCQEKPKKKRMKNQNKKKKKSIKFFFFISNLKHGWRYCLKLRVVYIKYRSLYIYILYIYITTHT
jgi:hypothetical protein